MEEWEPVSSSVTYIKPSQLKEGDFVVGVFEGTELDTKYNTFKHKLLQDDGSTKILNGSGQLNNTMKKIPVGTKIRIVFKGKKKLESGKHKGTDANQWEVSRAKSQAPTNQEVNNHIADKVKEHRESDFAPSENAPF